MQAYLFVHFREKTTPDGEQVYFGVSKDGFNWEEVNGGAPVLWAYYGDKGVRDFTVVRCKNPQTGKEKFVILATDLSLSYGMRGQYHHSWDEIGHNGSKSLAIWESDDLVNWTEQRLAKIGDEQFGCLWAPDVIYDKKEGDYVVHWSSSHARNNYGEKAIFYSRTKDFKEFSKPEILYEWKEHDIIDSALYEEDGSYYLFVKCGQNPARTAEKLNTLLLLQSEQESLEICTILLLIRFLLLLCKQMAAVMPQHKIFRSLKKQCILLKMKLSAPFTTCVGC